MKYFIIFFIILSLFNGLLHADESIKTVSYNQCFEKNSIFDQSNCRFFTSYFASVNVVGGGNHTQLINFVGNVDEPIVVIDDNSVGAITCPDGLACTNLDPPVKISIVRSPIPFSNLQVIPGGNISFGFAYALTQDTGITKSGLPYAYQIYEEIPGSSFQSQCASASPTDITWDFLDTTPDTQQPNCGVGLLSDVDLRGSCGSPSLAPLPTGWLTDNNGQVVNQCTEICCGNSQTVRIRQLAPYCYAYKASTTPILVVDFLIVIESDQLPGGNVTIPIYGSVNIGESIVVESNGIRITVVANQQIPTSLLENTVSNGWLIFCGNNSDSAIPNEASPVDDITQLEWFYQPANYIPYYSDETNGKGVVSSPSFTDPHTETYGISGYDDMNLVYNYMKTLQSSVSDCVDLSAILPNVPGYDTDNPILPDASPYNMPSYCNMWHEARSGNYAFLPPASIIPDGFNHTLFNWMVKRNIGSISNPNPMNGQTYIIYFPNQEQIDASQYRNDLIDAIQFQIDFASGSTTSNYATNYGDVTMPVDIIQQNTIRKGTLNIPLTAPSCWFADPDFVDPRYVFGSGQMMVQLESIVSNDNINAAALSNPVSNIQVSISCTGKQSSGKDQSTPNIDVTSDSVVTIPPISAGGVSDIIVFNLSAMFVGDYHDNAVKGSVIANCAINVIYNLQNPSSGSFTQNFQCQVSSVFLNIDATPNPCKWWDLSCQSPIYGSWFFWFCIVLGVVLLVVFAVLIWEFVKKGKTNELIQEKESSKEQRDEKIELLKSKINVKKLAEEREIIESIE